MAKVTTILIAEDDENDVFFLTRLLSRMGEYKVQVVADGPQAIRYLQGKGEFEDRRLYPQPDGLILDLGLPQRDGLEILQWLKDHPQSAPLPVLVCSGSEFPDHIERAHALGAVSVVMKPADAEQMSAFMSGIGKSATHRNAPVFFQAAQ